MAHPDSTNARLHDPECRTRLVPCVTTVDDRRAILLGAGGQIPVHFCENARQVAASLQQDGVVGVVLELGADSESELEAIVAALERRPLPLLLRSTPCSAAFGQIVRYHDCVPGLRISLAEFDPLERCIATLLSDRSRETARLAILARIASLVSESALDIVAGAAVVGTRAVSAAELAAFCGCSIRALELRLGEAGVLPPKPLLMWMLALHATWRVSHLGWSPKRAAAEAGLRSERALSNRVERATGVRLAVLCRTRGFVELLEDFAGVLVAQRAS